jgi:hypothetical protein
MACSSEFLFITITLIALFLTLCIYLDSHVVEIKGSVSQGIRLWWQAKLDSTLDTCTSTSLAVVCTLTLIAANLKIR